MLSGCWWLVVVTGLLYLCRRSSRAGKKKTVPSLPAALCSPGLRSLTAARERVIVISVHRGCSQLRTLLQPATALVSPVSCPPSLATDNDEPSLDPALWSLVATPAAPNKFCPHAARHLGQVEQGTCYDSNIVLQL